MRSALMKRRIRGDSTLFSFENNISCHSAEKILVGEERGMILFIDKSMLRLNIYMEKSDWGES